MEYQFESMGPSLRYVVLAFLLVFALLLLGLIVLLAALPGYIAGKRAHPQAQAVGILGCLGLPTGVLWVIAMAWAFWRYEPGAKTSGTVTGMGTGGTGTLEGITSHVESLEQLLTQLEARRGGKQ